MAINILSSILNTFRLIGQKFSQKKNTISYELYKEIRTGDYWIDGKPIYFYMTSFRANTVANAWNTVTIGSISDVSDIVDYSCIYRRSNPDSSRKFQYYRADSSIYRDSNTYAVIFVFLTNDNRIQLSELHSNNFGHNYPVYVKLWYTK